MGNCALESIDYNQFDVVIAMFPGKAEQDYTWDNPCPECLTSHYTALKITAISGEIIINKIAFGEESKMGTWVHETGHSIGNIIRGRPLCDLYGPRICDYGGATDDTDNFIGEWALMATGSKVGTPKGTVPTHISSFSKMKLGWLGEDNITYGPYTIESLETMNYQDQVKRFDPPNAPDLYYLFETRTNRPEFSKWDTGLDKDALVVYQVLLETIRSGEQIQIVNKRAIVNPNNDSFGESLGEFMIRTEGDVIDIPNKSYKINTQLNQLATSDMIGMVMRPDNSILKETWVYDPQIFAKAPNQEQGIEVWTDKNEYDLMSSIEIKVKNNTNKPIFYILFSDPMRKNEKGEWEVMYKGTKDMFEYVEKIEPGEIISTENLMYRYNYINKPGTYRITVSYYTDKQGGNPMDVYSNEFTVSNEFTPPPPTVPTVPAKNIKNNNLITENEDVKIKLKEKEHITVIEDKGTSKSYRNSEIKIYTVNKTNKKIWYLGHVYEIQRLTKDGNWETFFDSSIPSDIGSIAYSIDFQGGATFTLSASPNGEIKEPGTYRLVFRYSFEEQYGFKFRGETKTTYSAPFTVKFEEKKAPPPSVIPPKDVSSTQKPINILEDPTKTNQIYLTLLSALLLLISIVLRLNEKTSKKYSKLLNILIAIFTIVLIFSITKVMAKTDNQTSQTEQQNKQQITKTDSVKDIAKIQNISNTPMFLDFTSGQNNVSPDLDLHAITPDNLHIGVNYDTGEYENQIPGATASGDLTNSYEWIFVPENTQVKYYVSSYDIEQFLTQNPDIASQLATTQETYTLSAMYYNATSQKFESTPLVDQPIDPGETIIHTTIGTTDISVSQGTPDTTPPQTTATPTGTMGNNNYYISDVTVDFTATDPTPTGQESTGILKTRYSLDDGVTWDVYATSTPLIIDTEGTNTIFYKSIDRANNQEPTQSMTLNIDKTTPTIFASDTSAEQLTEQGTYLDIQATAEDNIDTNPTLTSDIPLSQTFPPGTTDILLTSIDFAGNIATSTITITIFSTPIADPDGDCVANQDDVKPFDPTIFSNIILPQEYSYWEKETFNYPFSIAGVGNVEMTFSDIYYEIEETDPVKDNDGNIVPTTITNTDGITTISFTQNTKENTNYTLTIKTKKGNKKEKEKIKKKKDEEQDQEKKDELEKELKFVEAPITVKLTSNTCPNTLEVSSPINIYDKEKKASIH